MGAAVAARHEREGRQERLGVRAAPSADGEPGRPPAQVEEAVVGEEAHERPRRKVEDVARDPGPHGAGHRDDVPIDEGLRVAAAREVVAEADPRIGTVLEQRRCFAVEAQDAAEQAPVARAQRVPLLREEARELGAAAVLDAGAVDPRAEAHVAGAVLHAELLHERAEARVGALVEDDEARVDRNRDTVDVDVHRRRMPADPVTRLVERDRVAGVVEPSGGHHPGDARPDDCDAHQLPGWMRFAFSARSGTGRMSHTRPKTASTRRA